MSSGYPHLLAPIRLGPVVLENRVIMSPMTTSYGGSDGHVTRRQIAYYAARAWGGVAAVFVENAYIDREGICARQEIGVCDDSFLPGLRDLAAAIHGGGARAFLQLSHGGSRSLLPPGRLPLTPAGRGTAGPGRAATAAEVEGLVDAFLRSALLAGAAGFDGIELHAAHGYLGHEFVSPAFNTRDDAWGGSPAGRARLFTEAARRIRAAAPDLAITVRLSVEEFTPGGLDLPTTLAMVPHLLAAGVDALHASSGGGPLTRQQRHYTTGAGEATMIHLARGLRAAAGSTPIIAVGRLLTPERCERAIAEGDTDLVALGRALLADPDWVRRARQGRSVRVCVGCQACQFRADKPASVCPVNPALGHEVDRPVATAGSSVVVGAGVAGLAAAEAAARLGRKVSLWTRHLPWGGLWGLRSRVPGNGEIAAVLEWYRQELVALGVAIAPGEPAPGALADDPQWIDARPGPPLAAALPGAGPLPLSAEAVLAGSAGLPPGPVAVMGGGLVAGETALLLAAAGRSVTLLCPEAAPFADAHPEIALRLGERLAAHAVVVLTAARATAWDGRALTVAGRDRPLALAALIDGAGWGPPAAGAAGDAYEAGELAAAAVAAWQRATGTAPGTPLA